MYNVSHACTGTGKNNSFSAGIRYSAPAKVKAWFHASVNSRNTSLVLQQQTLYTYRNCEVTRYLTSNSLHYMYIPNYMYMSNYMYTTCKPISKSLFNPQYSNWFSIQIITLVDIHTRIYLTLESQAVEPTNCSQTVALNCANLYHIYM